MVPRNAGHRDMAPKDRDQGTVPGGIAGRLEIMAPAATATVTSLGQAAGVMGRRGRKIRDP